MDCAVARPTHQPSEGGARPRAAPGEGRRVLLLLSRGESQRGRLDGGGHPGEPCRGEPSTGRRRRPEIGQRSGHSPSEVSGGVEGYAE